MGPPSLGDEAHTKDLLPMSPSVTLPSTWQQLETQPFQHPRMPPSAFLQLRTSNHLTGSYQKLHGAPGRLSGTGIHPNGGGGGKHLTLGVTAVSVLALPILVCKTFLHAVARLNAPKKQASEGRNKAHEATRPLGQGQYEPSASTSTQTGWDE